MITVNFTLFVELALFLLFLAGAYKIAWRPLLETMDQRAGKIDGDRAAAEKSRKEAHRLEGVYVEQLTAAHQEAAHRLAQARYDAYQSGRAQLDALRVTAEKEIDTFREAVDRQVGEEQAKVAGLMAEVIEAADGKISAEGSIL